MADYGLGPDASVARSERVLTFVTIFGWVALLAGVVGGGFLFMDAVGARGESGGVSAAAVTWAVLVMVGGVLAAALLWGLEELVRTANRLADGQDDLQSTLTTLAARTPQGAGEDGDARWDELALLVRELRDISLLDDSQRKMRLEAQGRAALERLQREVPVLLREHNWIVARNRVQTLRERFPQLAEVDTLEKQIESMRAQVEQHDIEAAERQIKDLVALDAWHRVEEVLTELLQRHPDSVKAIELGHRVRQERHKALADARGRLMMRAQEAVNGKDWSGALEAANTLIQRFPQSTEAQSVRLQLPTLRANADRKARIQLEERIIDLLRDKRNDEALRLAREMLDNYPNSPQAEKLREMLPDIERKVYGG